MKRLLLLLLPLLIFFSPITANAANLTNGWYIIQPKKSSVLRMGVLDTKNNIKLYNAANKAGQKFIFQKQTDGTWKIGTGTTVGMSVLSTGAKQQKYNSSDKKQKWTIIANADNSYQLINVSTGKALQYSSLTDKGNIIEATKSTVDTQKFLIIPFVEKYTVTFTDGSKTLKRQSVKKNGTATAPNIPTRTGYTFAGWDKTFNKITANTTVTAKWTPKTTKVTFNINIPGDTRTYVENYTYGTANQTFGKDLKDKSGSFGIWSRAGYSLLGWSIDKNATKATYSIYSPVIDSWINNNNGTVDLYAIWAKKGTVTPEEFGAKGNGTTDDTDAIKKAIDFGANVNFTKTYYVTSSIPVKSNNINLYGGGTFKTNNIGVTFSVKGKKVNFTNLKFTNTGKNSAFIYIGTGKNDSNDFGTVINNCTFNNSNGSSIHMHGYGSSAPQYIEAPRGVKNRVTDVTISNCTFNNSTKQGICGAGMQNVKILNNIFNTSSSEHITVDWESKDVTVNGNIFNGTHRGTGAIGVDGAVGLTIDKNTFNSSGSNRADSSVGLNHELYNGPIVNTNITVTNNKFNKCKYGIARNTNTTGWYMENGKMEYKEYKNKTVIKTIKYSGNTCASGVTLYGENIK